MKYGSEGVDVCTAELFSALVFALDFSVPRLTFPIARLELLTARLLDELPT